MTSELRQNSKNIIDLSQRGNSKSKIDAIEHFPFRHNGNDEYVHVLQPTKYYHHENPSDKTRISKKKNGCFVTKRHTGPWHEPVGKIDTFRGFGSKLFSDRSENFVYNGRKVWRTNSFWTRSDVVVLFGLCRMPEDCRACVSCVSFDEEFFFDGWCCNSVVECAFRIVGKLQRFLSGS